MNKTKYRLTLSIPKEKVKELKKRAIEEEMTLSDYVVFVSDEYDYIKVPLTPSHPEKMIKKLQKLEAKDNLGKRLDKARKKHGPMRRPIDRS